MISGDFFCNSSRPSCRISVVSIVPTYPICFIIPAALVETIRSASRSVPSHRPSAASRFPPCLAVSRSGEKAVSARLCR